MAINGSLFGYAGKAAKQTEEEKQKELNFADVEGLSTDELIEKYTTGDEAPEWLQRYVLGDNLVGQDFNNIWSNDSFTNENVKYMNSYDCGHLSYMLARYEGTAYMIIVEFDTEGSITKSVKKVYKPKTGSMEGEIVGFSVDGSSTISNWLVLYDNGDTIDIMKLNTLGPNLVLGAEDEEAIGNTPEEKAIYSYNNAIQRINSYCESLVTNPLVYKVGNKRYVRSVGSKPDFSDNDTNQTYYSNDFEAYNGIGKVGDINLEQDTIRMSFFSLEDNYETFGFAYADSRYWLASRTVWEEDQSFIDFYIRGANGSVAFDEELFYIDYNDGICANESTNSLPVRPIVRVLKTNVTNKNPNEPYR